MFTKCEWRRKDSKSNLALKWENTFAPREIGFSKEGIKENFYH
jgi:hypothetical protein